MKLALETEAGHGGRYSVVERDGKFPGPRLKVGDRVLPECFCPPLGAGAISNQGDPR